MESRSRSDREAEVKVEVLVIRMNDEQRGTESMFCPICQMDKDFDIVTTYGTYLSEKYTHTKRICTKCGTRNNYSTHWDKDNWQVGNCTVCGKHCAFNTPMLRCDNGDLVCNTCADSGKPEDVVLIGVEQYLKDGYYQFPGRETHCLNRNVVWAGKGCSISAWTHGGQRVFKFKDDEVNLSIIEMFHLMEVKVDDDHFRCTGCCEDFDGQPSGYPLFAGARCEVCWQIHLDYLEHRKGMWDVQTTI